MASTPWTPGLRLDSRAGHCHLTLEGVTYGAGPTLQEASNDLVVRVHDLALGLRRGCRTDGLSPEASAFLWEVGDIITTGGNIRLRILG